MFNRIGGIKEEVYEEGTHFMLPWFERPIIYDVRARPNVITSTSGSRDLQMVRACRGRRACRAARVVEAAEGSLTRVPGVRVCGRDRTGLAS